MDTAARLPPHLLPEAAPHGRWSGGGQDWELVIAGDWRGHTQPLPEPPATLQHGRVTVQAGALRSWDARLASALWQRLAALDRNRVVIDLHGLPPGLQQILRLALPTPAATAQAPAPAAPETQALPPSPPLTPPSHWLTRLGARAATAGERLRFTLEFLGETLLALTRLLRGRSGMRLADLAWQAEETGPRSLPIVVLVSLLVGLIVAYMGAAQFERFGAQAYIAELVTVGAVREIAALLVGIVLAGRVGAAFAAQLGSMHANEEIDALRILGVDPVDYLVLPRVLALLLVGPLLTAFAALVGIGVGGVVAVASYGVTPLDYVYTSVQSLTMPHVLIGLLKGSVYAVLVALAGCRQGLAAGRSAQAVGDATTAAVVQAIVWIAVAASTLTVIFQRLGW